MKRMLAILAAVLIIGLLGAPAFAQQSPVDDVGGVVVTPPRPLPGAPAAPVASVRGSAPARAGLADTGLELTTGAALAGSLVLGGALLLAVARKRASSLA